METTTDTGEQRDHRQVIAPAAPSTFTNGLPPTLYRKVNVQVTDQAGGLRLQDYTNVVVNNVPSHDLPTSRPRRCKALIGQNVKFTGTAHLIRATPTRLRASPGSGPRTGYAVWWRPTNELLPAPASPPAASTA